MAASIGLVVVVWAINFIAAKIGLRYLPPVTMASFRVVLAGLSMMPAYFICSRLPAFANARRARLKGFRGPALWGLFLLGILRRGAHPDVLHDGPALHVGEPCGRHCGYGADLYAGLGSAVPAGA